MVAAPVHGLGRDGLLETTEVPLEAAGVEVLRPVPFRTVLETRRLGLAPGLVLVAAVQDGVAVRPAVHAALPDVFAVAASLDTEHPVVPAPVDVEDVVRFGAVDATNADKVGGGPRHALVVRVADPQALKKVGPA